VIARRGRGRTRARVPLDPLLEPRDDPHRRHPLLVWHGDGEGLRRHARDRRWGVIPHRGLRHADAAPRRDRDRLAPPASPLRRRGARCRYAAVARERRGDQLMLHVVERKWWYFLLSGMLIVPGVIFL